MQVLDLVIPCSGGGRRGSGSDSGASCGGIIRDENTTSETMTVIGQGAQWMMHQSRHCDPPVGDIQA